MMWGFGLNWLSMTLMVLGSTLWIVLLVILAWALLRWLNKRAASPDQQTERLPEQNPTALEILQQRYARSEIDAMTFEQMRERLEGANDTYRRSRANGHHPVGEQLFDGNNSGSDTL